MERSQRLILTIAILASVVAFLDGTLVNVALPAIERELGGGLTTQQWVVDAYLITLGSLILVAGSLSDAFGRLLILRIGLYGFAAASVIIAIAPDPVILIIGRAAQGAAGAFLVPSSLALITARFDDQSRGRAIGLWTALTTGALVAGPLIGGLFVDYLSWRWAFAINLVPIALTLWLLHVLGERDQRRPGARIDVLGALLCTLGLGAAVFALIEQPNLGWGSPLIWGTFAGGILLFALFLWRQRTAPEPILPLGLFRIRNFWAGNLTTLVVYAALALNGFVVAVYLQEEAGFSATLAGLASLPATLMLVALSTTMGSLSSRFGPRLFMTVGPFVIAIGALLLLTVTAPLNYWLQVLPGLVLFGLGLAITVSPLTAAILGAVDPAQSGIASAVNNAVARIAGLLVIATLSTIVAGALDLYGFHRAAIVTAALLVVGGIISFLGIRNPRGRMTTDSSASTSPSPAPDRLSP